MLQPEEKFIEKNNILLRHVNGTNKFAAIFPGAGNNTKIALLHYAFKAALLSGFDVLSLNYDHKAERSNINTIAADCHDAINKCMDRKYSDMVFISKSYGTLIAGEVALSMRPAPIRQVFYTPVRGSIPYINGSDCLVLNGTNDKYFSDEDVGQISNNNNVRLVRIENTGHSLELDDDCLGSIDILKNVTELCMQFLGKLFTTR